MTHVVRDSLMWQGQDSRHELDIEFCDELLQVMSHVTKWQFQLLGCKIGSRAAWPESDIGVTIGVTV